MIRFSHVRVGCALIALGCVAWGAELPLASYKSPTYPPLARLARIAGTVVLEFEVDAERGASVVLVSGHPLLAPSAKENLLLRANGNTRFPKPKREGWLRGFSLLKCRDFAATTAGA